MQNKAVLAESSPECIKHLYSEIGNAYTERYGDDLSDAAFVDLLIQRLPIGGRALDAGCGPGTYTKYLADAELDVEGIDLSPTMIEIAKRRLPQHTFTEMDMRNLSCDAESFDGVLAAYSLIHIPNDELQTVLREFARVLRPGGALLIIGQLGKPDHVQDDPLAPGSRVFVNFFSETRLTDALTAAHFDVLATTVSESVDATLMSNGVICVLATSQPR